MPALLTASFIHVKADFRLPASVGSHMVLQRGKLVNIWGYADPSEEITISLNKRTVKTQTGADGK